MPKNEFKMVGIDEETKKNLVAAALIAMERAYIPYSKFPVGAALLTEDGSIITGGNVENASYGGTICAERSAIVRAIAEGHRKFKGIVVATNSLKPASPCGICRQFLFEFGDFPVILISGKSDEITTTSVKDLLPGGFGPQSLADFAAEGNV
uniref:Cytidine deaminase n=1 Tax=Panagrolaimus sp. PS1159 TaxID=55785 RepID=A0AC35GWN9_9BILA